MTKRTLWMVSAGVEAVSGIERAREMGLHVVVSDGDWRAPGMDAADDRVLASTYDVAATVSAAREYHSRVRRIDGVICVAADVPHTVAAVARALRLPGISVPTSKLAMDKLAMKRRFRRDGVAVPWFSAVSDVERLDRIRRARRGPLILKPVDSRGARGVVRLLDRVSSPWAFSFAKRESPTGRVMVEDFVTGPQISTESVVLAGRTYTPGFSDRNYGRLEDYAPHVVEDGGDMPSALPARQQNAVRRLVSRAAASLGVRNGTVKGDIVVHEGKPYVIELAPRLSGGYFCTHEIPLNTGVDFLGAAIRLALGDTVKASDVRAGFQRPVVQRYMFPKPGRVTRVAGARTVSRRKGIAYCEVRVKKGDVIKKIRAHPGRAGVVIATARTIRLARERAVSAVRDIEIRTVPL